ncbi:hypothetical protein MAGR_58740 [Mycolicibacterium agri]|uniref:DUF218 domain-containing protein n=2 Tax=Mycolicibacterium agri TaxID=36811 RepID=A0A7I9W9Q1_MYCAG|nr:hypothetical protein MAGR_58740 [Mycolicibacterium agri]
MRWGVAALVVLTVVTMLGWPVYVTPQVDQLRHADAVFVLGGSGDAAYTLGLEYALQGYTADVVFSNPNGAEAIWLTDLCSHQRYRFTVSCVEPNPRTTRGEARALERLATAKGWHSVIVLTDAPHITRARYIIQRCFHGDLMMRESETELSPLEWARSFIYQTAGFVRAAVQSGC